MFSFWSCSPADSSERPPDAETSFLLDDCERHPRVCDLPLATGDANLREDLILIAVAIALASNVNLMIGYTGYVNFGNVVFYGLGGYIGLYLTTVRGWPLIPAAIAAGIVVSAFTLLFGIVDSAIKGSLLRAWPRWASWRQ